MATKAYEFVPDLLDDFVSKRVALFLGSGVSAGVQTRSKQNVRTWDKFLIDCLKKVGEHTKRQEIESILKAGDLLLGCELLKEELGDTWNEILRGEYDQIGEVTGLQKAIIGLNPRIIVTTNFDKFFESAWDGVKTEATHHLKVEVGISDSSFDLFRSSDPCLFKLHGSISDTKSMIFAKSEYIAKAYSSWAYSKFLEVLFTTHTVLFIGFSLSDPAISHILELHANLHPRGRPHYAFMPDTVGPLKRSAMKSLKKLYVISYSSQANHKELEDKIKQLSAAVTRRNKIQGL